VGDFLKALAEGVLIPIATAVAASWWKILSKPEQATGEDRLLAFEHLVAAAALVIIGFFRAWANPNVSKNQLGWHGLLFVVLIFVLLGFANRVKHRVFMKSETHFLAAYADPWKQDRVYRVDPSTAVRLSVLTAMFLLAVFLVDYFVAVLT
jgi:hypothetical protein